MILLVLITNVFLMVMYLQQLRLTQVLRKKSVLTIRYAGNSKQAYLILLFQYINVTAIWITPIILDLLGSNIF